MLIDVNGKKSIDQFVLVGFGDFAESVRRRHFISIKVCRIHRSHVIIYIDDLNWIWLIEDVFDAVLHQDENLQDRRIWTLGVSVENMSCLLCVLEHLWRFPTNHSDLVSTIYKLVVIDTILKILVSLDCWRNIRGLVEEMEASMDDLVPQIVNNGIPEGANCTPITSYG
jgi:hypothetical protein